MIGPHTVELVRPAGRDAWGNVVTGETTVTVTGCFWQPVSSSEAQDGSDTVTTVARLFMPAGADPTAADRIRFGGREYEINGRPSLFHTPRGPHHWEIDLRDVEG
ncbi:MAG: head-tail adaptor protein [Steroidobacteraceae bacterium]|nr:head-tail adaptor protein [Steroidobacteraceae bacterium]